MTGSEGPTRRWRRRQQARSGCSEWPFDSTLHKRARDAFSGALEDTSFSGISPEPSTSRSLPQQRCVLHWRRTFSFTAQWKRKSSRPGKGERDESSGPSRRSARKRRRNLADC